MDHCFFQKMNHSLKVNHSLNHSFKKNVNHCFKKVNHCFKKLKSNSKKFIIVSNAILVSKKVHHRCFNILTGRGGRGGVFSESHGLERGKRAVVGW